MKKKSNGNENMSASSSDEIFDLNKIPIEVLDKGYVSPVQPIVVNHPMGVDADDVINNIGKRH